MIKVLKNFIVFLEPSASCTSPHMWQSDGDSLPGCRGWLLRYSNYFLYGDIGLLRCIEGKLLNSKNTGLHFNTAYTHSGTSCPQCVYLYFHHNSSKTLAFRSNVCKSGICIGSRKYLNEYMPYWSVSLWKVWAILYVGVCGTTMDNAIFEITN